MSFNYKIIIVIVSPSASIKRTLYAFFFPHLALDIRRGARRHKSALFIVVWSKKNDDPTSFVHRSLQAHADILPLLFKSRQDYLDYLVGRWIAALPPKPVHNTVQVYQLTRTTRLIRLHSNARPCALPLMMEGCSAIPWDQPSPVSN